MSALIHRVRHRLSGSLAAVLGTLLLLVAVPAHAAGAAPERPVLNGPSHQVRGVATPPRLSVNVSDPERDDLTVRFFARQRAQAGGTNTSPDFTLMTLPDTQNYVSIAANRAIMGAQTQWIADQRRALNIALVSHLGDVVGSPDSDSQFSAASRYMATLDNAGVPNTVLPGNHDMDVATGAAPMYDRYFPPSRYANASWNSPTVRYGGYLGQNLFGADPVNRGNKDNFVLLTAGGMDFVVINLEFNAPDYALDWAKRVLAAYPTRRAILVTHNMIGVDGRFSYSVNRPGGNYPDAIWSKLVAPTCRFFLVVNGHNHAGDRGEAYRSMDNSCGQPVRMVLADYQSRAKGGDGWLRYFVFKPSQNLIQAVTYSPTRREFETDASSAFTFPYDMTSPAPFRQVGQVTVASGATASVALPGTGSNTSYEWYATVDDRTSTTTGPTWSFTTSGAAPTEPSPAKPAPTGAWAADAFSRTASNGWRSADRGGAWSVGGTTARYTVSGGVGSQQAAPGSSTTATLGPVPSTATDTTVRVALPVVPAGGAAYVYVGGRSVGSAEYGARVKVDPGGALSLHAVRSGTALTGARLGTSLAANEALLVRVQVQGTSPTTVRVKAWKASGSEPRSWHSTTTDRTAALQRAGGVSLRTYASSSVTSGSVRVQFDNLAVRTVG